MGASSCSSAKFSRILVIAACWLVVGIPISNTAHHYCHAFQQWPPVSIFSISDTTPAVRTTSPSTTTVTLSLFKKKLSTDTPIPNNSAAPSSHQSDGRSRNKNRVSSSSSSPPSKRPPPPPTTTMRQLLMSNNQEECLCGINHYGPSASSPDGSRNGEVVMDEGRRGVLFGTWSGEGMGTSTGYQAGKNANRNVFVTGFPSEAAANPNVPSERMIQQSHSATTRTVVGAAGGEVGGPTRSSSTSPRRRKRLSGGDGSTDGMIDGSYPPGGVMHASAANSAVSSTRGDDSSSSLSSSSYSGEEGEDGVSTHTAIIQQQQQQPQNQQRSRRRKGGNDAKTNTMMTPLVRRRATIDWTKMKESMLKISNVASLLCVLDCTILPIVTLVLPLFGLASNPARSLWLHELGHSVALGFVLPVGGLAATLNYLSHRQPILTSIAALGLTLIYSANAPHGAFLVSSLPHHWAHMLHCGTVLHRTVNIAGCAMLLGSNYVSKKSLNELRGGKCCDLDHDVESQV